MTTKRKPRSATARRKKPPATPIANDDVRRAWLLIQSLTCALIGKLESVLASYDASDEGWERLFGAKDSTVINLQKLVAVLGEISDRLAHQHSDAGETPTASAPMATEDMAMLKRWLEQELNQLQTNG